jgi:hypothetical protein
MSNYIKPDPNDPAYQLIVGNPPEVIGATKLPRILLINLHGTEHLAARVMHHIQTERKDLLPHVDYICGNPRAAAANPQQRYTNEDKTDGERGTDLNRSFNFNKTPKTYEEKRAVELFPLIKAYDYVFDLHTTTTSAGSSQRFGITTQADAEEIRIAIAASPIERVVVIPQSGTYMTDVIKQAMAFEFNQEYACTAKGIGEIVSTIDVLVGNKKPSPQPREFFYVERPIPRAEDPGMDTPNFELCKDGYYPVLLGDNSYRKDPTKPYVGFAATKKETITL